MMPMLVALSLAVVECTGHSMKPSYTEAQLSPMRVNRLSDDEISIRYHVYPESDHYSNGANYKRVGQELRVVMTRAVVGDRCVPMSKTVIRLDNEWEAEVHIPYHGEQVNVIYVDGERRAYP
jgi:prepilin-type processing-associated H-X9-DG protein